MSDNMKQPWKDQYTAGYEFRNEDCLHVRIVGRTETARVKHD